VTRVDDCADGGYAFGLEPDVRGPVSQPAALRVLDEVGALGRPRAPGWRRSPRRMVGCRRCCPRCGPARARDGRCATLSALAPWPSLGEEVMTMKDLSTSAPAEECCAHL
jgi:hypothetical protein